MKFYILNRNLAQNSILGMIGVFFLKRNTYRHLGRPCKRVSFVRIDSNGEQPFENRIQSSLLFDGIFEHRCTGYIHRHRMP